MISASVESNLEQFNDALKNYAEKIGKTPQRAVAHQAKSFSVYLQKRLLGLAPEKGSIRSARISILEGKRGRDSKGGKINQGSGVKVRPSILRKVAAKYGAATSTTDRKTYLTLTGRKRKGQRIAFKGVRQSVLVGKVKDEGGQRKLNLQALAVRMELNIREGAIGSLGYFATMRGLGKLSPGERAEWIGRLNQKIADASLDSTRTDTESAATMSITLGGDETNFGEGMMKPKGQAALADALQDTVADMNAFVEAELAKEAGNL